MRPFDDDETPDDDADEIGELLEAVRAAVRQLNADLADALDSVYHSDLSPEQLEQLAGDEHRMVREAAASHPDLPLELVERLAQDEAPTVRAAVGRRDDLPAEYVPRLAQDPAWQVRAAAAGRSDLPPEFVGKLAEDTDWMVREAVAGREDLTGPAAAYLAGDPIASVVRTLAANPACPREVLEHLAEDRDERVR